jgi:hypothetical protein
MPAAYQRHAQLIERFIGPSAGFLRLTCCGLQVARSPGRQVARSPGRQVAEDDRPLFAVVGEQIVEHSEQRFPGLGCVSGKQLRVALLRRLPSGLPILG